ncbi:MAG: cellulase family glycosylhydrolase [Bacteroidota bacterium]|nr:cellulase family glycosylhydrolase [Bacteroidota bacterium]
MRRSITSLLLLGALSFGQVLAQGTATYELTFTATWSAATHPQDFPPNPHFSGLIGATHNSNVYFWATGEPASQGIRFMAELGTKGALTAEVNEALDQGTAFALLDGGSIPVSPGVRKMTFEIIPHYPLVTVTAMLAPSPDWFVGTRGLALLDNDRWVDSLIVDLFVYDAGTDSGPRYTSANQATNPPENIERIQTDPFLVDGSVRPVGTFRFDLKSIDLSREGYHTTNELEILDPSGQPAVQKGIGLGGWLMPEGYMLHMNAPRGGGPTALFEQMVDLIGQEDTEEFWALYRANYLHEKDIARIAEWGFDHVRLPFHYNLFWNEEDQRFDDAGFALLDEFLEWCQRHQLGVILDMHAAPGAQSDGGIADSDGVARLWTEPEKYWPLTIRIWREIARRYNDNKVIIGYDLINEPVIPDGVETSELRRLYAEIIAAVRPVDPHHIIFLEGNYFATTFGDLEPPLADNTVYAFHKYWNAPTIGTIQYLLDLRRRTGTPLWLGETGENQNGWAHAVAQLSADNNFGYNWWTHKKIQTTTSPLSVPFAPGYQAVVDFWRGEGPKPTEEEAENALFAMARGLHIDSARVNRGLLLALHDPDFTRLRMPYREHKIPGYVNAADYDYGFHGVTYSDTDLMATDGNAGSQGNRGWSYRNDGVDIAPTHDPEGYNYYVGWTQRLEWLTYTVSVETEGVYDVDFRVASATGNGEFRLLVNDVQVGEDVEVASTGGHERWETLILEGIELTAGEHILKLLFTEPFVNINRMTFRQATATTVTGQEEVPAEASILSTYPNPFPDQVHVRFVVPEPTRVSAQFYDILGRRIFETQQQMYEAGKHTLKISPELTPGVYMFRLMLEDSGGSVRPITRSIVRR